ncbi:MAG: glycosyltransferase [Actinomyces sp.]|uniref:glycosyltransferase family 2 protein n=1 Tax=Actinomyces sp. TaxID=29317 RepID=UPI0026DCBAF4|nr:glycosyltransferase [Actinomyces sp.]MDO4243471.1 glycosyltransferase [Actinomyces sp.]
MTGARALTVAIPTYKRPEALARALAGVGAEIGGLPAAQQAVAEVLVIDNDPQGSAGPVVAEAQAGPHGAHLRLVAEPTPGVAAVRNRALDEAGISEADGLLVFIDDDEAPEPGWLSLLLQTRERFGAQAVAGLVVPDYEVSPDAWVRAGGFFDRRTWPTGTARGVAATNNLLVDLAFVRGRGLRFDEAFGATGGEDTLFTRRLVAAGGTIVWCAEARVRDHVPVERLDHGWILRRQRSHAATAVRVDLALAGPGAHLGRRARALGGGALRVAAGYTRQCAGLLTGSMTHRARGARLVARGRGMAAAALGRGVHAEYGR